MTTEQETDERRRLERAREIALFRYSLIQEVISADLTAAQRGRRVRELAAAVAAGFLRTNHDMDSKTPFATVLIGQPTLRRMIKLGVLAALDQAYDVLAGEAAERGRTLVLIIDEAHLLDHDQLESDHGRRCRGCGAGRAGRGLRGRGL